MEKTGVTVIGVSPDGIASHHAWRLKQNLNFPLVADENGALCTALGACSAFAPGQYNYIERTAYVVQTTAAGLVLQDVFSINGPEDQITALINTVLSAPN